ncbi:PAS domain-containing protein [Baekduia sp. Peel2402]|uniref:PAS domain-containing protein n=1 Tax=Baekduia sp. Peel2402 TaxID=3458296 RepID=UPI00403EC8F7
MAISTTTDPGLLALLDYGTAGAALLDADGRYVFATRDYEEAHGLAPGTMVGTTDAELLDDDAVAARAEASRVALEAGRARFEHSVRGGVVCGDLLDLTAEGDARPRFGIVLRAVEHDDLRPTDEIRKRLHDAERRGRIGSWVWDLRSDLVSWSDELFRIHGREQDGEPVPLEEVLGHQHPGDREMVGELLRAAAVTADPFAFEHRVITVDERLRWMHCQGTTEVDAQGRPVRVRGTDQDITERRVVREQLARLHRRSQLILESISEGIVGLDRSARVTFANNAALRMIGATLTDLEDLSLEDVLRPPRTTPDHPIRATLEDGRERHLERALVRGRGGELLGVDFTVTPLRGRRRIEGAVVVLRDRSLREGYERQIALTMSALAEADAHRGELLASLVAAQELERRRIAGEIHDDAVQAMSAVALRAEQLAGSLDGTGAQRLTRLSDDVRDATARLRQLLIQLQPPELETAIGAAIEAYISTADFDFNYILNDDLREQPSHAARVVLYRVVQEALRNVAKHARATTVQITLEHHDNADGPGRVRLTVADDGIGVDAELLRTPQPGHYGIDTMRYRAELAGGHCTVGAGGTGSGTVVTVELPHHLEEETPR